MDELILSALIDKKIIIFQYDGFERICEPHVFGVANGKKQLLCYQIAGGTRRGGIPQWRRFELTGMLKLKESGESFPGKRPVPHPPSLGWDRIIQVVS